MKHNRRVDDDDEVPRRDLKRALRKDGDKRTALPSRPEGMLVMKISDTKHIRAEISDANEYHDEEQINIRTWVKKKDGWIRTGKGFFIPSARARDFAEKIESVIAELAPPPRRRRRSDDD